METRSFSIIELQMDAGAVETSVESLSGMLDGLEEKMDSITNQIICVFDSISNAVYELTAKLGELIFSLGTIAAWDFSVATTGLTEIADALEGISEQLQEQQSQDLWTSLVSSAISGVQVGVDIYATEIGRDKGKYESGGTSVFGGAEGNYTSNKDSSASGRVGADRGDYGLECIVRGGNYGHHGVWCGDGVSNQSDWFGGCGGYGADNGHCAACEELGYSESSSNQCMGVNQISLWYSGGVV